jgi:enoyl-CoA hydratase/carnithine racemase
MPRVTIARDGGVGRICLTYPERRNALGHKVITGLHDALDELERDREIGAIVLEGAPPGFCAGSDLHELAGLNALQMGHHEASTAAIVREIARLDTPVIAAVDGFAMGGGFILAAACDIVVTASSAKWKLPEVELGWIPPWGLEVLVARVGPVSARRLAWGFEMLSGHDVYRLGVADYIAIDSTASTMATSVAADLARLPRHATASTKRFFWARACANAESADREANERFILDCNDPAARTSLARFAAGANT